MADEINGISAYLQMLVDDEYVFIGGQRSHTHNVATSPIMITNQSAGEADRMLDGDGQITETVSMEVVFNSDASFMAFRDAAASRLIHKFKTIKPNLTEEPLEGMVVNYSEAPTSGVALSASFSIKIASSSANAPEYTNKTFGGGIENGGNPNYGSGGGGAGGGAGGSTAYSFYTAVYQNNCIDFWRLDESIGTKASNTGKGAAGFTKEPLYYNSLVDSSWLADSSINSQAGDSKNIAGFEERSLAGETTQTGTVFSRSNVWGIEFALEFNNNIAAVNDVILSFWDDDAVTTDGLDKLFKIQVNDASADVLNLVMYTTDDNITFTERTFIIAASIAALDSGFSYYSIFFESGVSFVVRINDVEIINEDASGWEANVSTGHTTAQFRVAALKDDPDANAFDGKIDVISTYASQTGILYSATNAYSWWATSTSTAPEVPAEEDFEAVIAALAPINWVRMNESSGLVAADDGSRATDLDYQQDASTAGYSISPSTAFTGGASQAKEFDVSIDSIQAASEDDLQLPSGDYTIEFGVQLPAEDSCYLFGYSDNGASNNDQYNIQFIDTGTQQLVMLLYDGDGANVQFVIDTDYTSKVNIWTWVSVTFDSTGELLDTRVNNVSETNLDTSAIVTNSSPVTGGLFSIGAFPNGSNVPKNTVQLDEIMMYDKVLTSTERDDNFNYWKFGDTSPPVGNTKADAIASPSQTLFQMSSFSDTISCPAQSWICFEMSESGQISQYLDSVQLSIGSDCDLAVWETVSAVDSEVAVSTSVSATASENMGAHDPTATRLMFLVKNNKGSAQNIQIFIPD